MHSRQTPAPVPASEFIAQHADSFGTLCDPNFKAAVLNLLTYHTLRTADICNLLLLGSGIKPTSLIVCSSAEEAVRLSSSLGEISKGRLSSAVHFDPSVDRYYAITWLSEEKRSFLGAITASCGILTRDHENHPVTEVTSCRTYHVELGKFLDVPSCCLVADAVMPEQADRLFSSLKADTPDSSVDPAIHFSPHLPCCPGCQESVRIGKIYETWIRMNVPELAADLERGRKDKPLYLY